MEQICLIGGLVTIGSVALALSAFNPTHNQTPTMVNSNRLFKLILTTLNSNNNNNNNKRRRRRSLSSSLNDSNNNRLGDLSKNDDETNENDIESTTISSILTCERKFYLLALSLLISLCIFTYNKIVLNAKSTNAQNPNLHHIVYHAFSFVLFVNFFCMLKSYAEYSSAFRQRYFRQRIASTAQMLNTALLCAALKVRLFSSFFCIYVYKGRIIIKDLGIVFMGYDHFLSPFITSISPLILKESKNDYSWKFRKFR
jgi:hypothetical protein